MSVEGYGELLRCRSRRQKKSRCRMVLSRAQAGRQGDQRLCGVLEGREGGEVELPIRSCPPHAKNKKDSPEPPETVLRLSRLEEHVNVVKIVRACFSSVADI